MKLKIKKLDKRAIIPQYQSTGAAGFDLHAIVDDSYEHSLKIDDKDYLMIAPRTQCIVKTGLAFEVPPGYELQIRPRSGLAFKQQITITNTPGTLDSDYRGELRIALYNLGENEYRLFHGDRIAQAIINKIELVEIEEVLELSSTERDKGGFGSTGK